MHSATHLSSDEQTGPKHPLLGPWNLYYSRRGKQSKHAEYKENL